MNKRGGKRSKRFRDWLTKMRASAGVEDPQEAFIPERNFEGLVGTGLARSEVRDAIMNGANASDCWEEYLPQAIWGVGIEDVTVIKAEQFLAKVFDGTYPEDARVIVNGDLQIASLTCADSKFFHLPHMVVRGSVEIYNAPHLESLSCLCTGWLTLHECPQLKQLKGEVFRIASLRDVGIEKLGADFRCAGNLIASGCPALELVNCEATEGVTLIGCGLKRTGAAFCTNGNLQIVNCPKVERLEGYVGGQAVLSFEGGDANLPFKKPDCSGLRAGRIILPEAKLAKLQKRYSTSGGRDGRENGIGSSI